MERRLSDNADGEREWNDEPSGFEAPQRVAEPRSGPLLHPARIDWVVPHPPKRQPLPNPDLRSEGPYGTCLYFGPRGERCDRPALEGGFCRRHLRRAGQASEPEEMDRGSDEQASVITARRVLAFLAALAASWPVVADFVRALLRHLK